MIKGPYAAFATDETVEQEGVWLEYPSYEFAIRVRRAGETNRAFTQRMDAKLKPYKRALDTGTMDPAILLRVSREVFAETILVDWKGVVDEKGKPMSFNKDNALKLLTDLPDLFNDIVLQAKDAGLFRKYLAEAEAGN